MLVHGFSRRDRYMRTATMIRRLVACSKKGVYDEYVPIMAIKDDAMIAIGR